MKRTGLCALFVGSTCSYLAWAHSRLAGEIALEKVRLSALGVSLGKQPHSRDRSSTFLRYARVLDSLNSFRRVNYGPGTLEPHLKAVRPILEEIRQLTTDSTAPPTGNWDHVNPHRSMYALVDMARVLRRQGEPKGAASWLRAALTLSKEWDESGAPFFTRIDGRLYAEAGALLRAFPHIRECIEVVQDIAEYSPIQIEAAIAACYGAYRSADADLARGWLHEDPCMPASDRQLAAIRIYNMGTTRQVLHLRALRCLRLQAEVLRDEKRSYRELLAAEAEALSTFWAGPMTDAGAFASCLFEEFPIGIAHPRTVQKARARLLRAALWLVKARGSGHLPTNLPSGPDFTDPFTLRPLILKEAPGGFRLYSAGRNGIDDGGFQGGSDDIELGRDYQTESR